MAIVKIMNRTTNLARLMIAAFKVWIETSAWDERLMRRLDALDPFLKVMVAILAAYLVMSIIGYNLIAR